MHRSEKTEKIFDDKKYNLLLKNTPKTIQIFVCALLN